MPSRRRLLAGIGSGALALLAGCAGGSNSASGADCHTSASEHGDGAVLDGAVMARGEDEAVVLWIPLDASVVRETGTTSIDLYVGDRLDTRIPVSAEDTQFMTHTPEDETLYYQHTLGDRPLHGEYRLLAVTGTGEPLDSLTVSFNCFARDEE